MQKLTSHFIDLTQDACLKAFWRKPALRIFLKQHGISEVKLSTWHGDETKRLFLQRLFADLVSVKNNKGHHVILDMARSLAEMSHFPDLEGWSDSKEKMALAREATGRIKSQVSQLNHKIRDEKAIEERKRQASEKRERTILARQTLEGLEKRLNLLVPKQGTQEGGYEFEAWFYDLMGFFELNARPPYKTDGRQIDGSFSLDGTDYLVETKYTKKQTGAPEIDVFMRKIERKADNTMGIFVSMTGFSSKAIEEASCDRTPMLLMDYTHIYNMILSARMSFPDVVRRIKQHAAQTGEALLAIDQFSG